MNAPITDGTYTFPATAGLQPGPYRVEISWPQKTGKKTESPDPEQVAEQTAETIPTEYNAASKLRIEVQPGENTFPFALPTK